MFKIQSSGQNLSLIKNYLLKNKWINAAAAISLLLCSESVFAQKTTETAPTGSTTMSDVGRLQLPNGLSLVPSVFTGARSDLKDSFSGASARNNTFGPFIRPELVAGFKNAYLSLNLKYDFETSGAQGFGSASKDFENNLYFKHEPIFTASVSVNPAWKSNFLIDYMHKTFNGVNTNSYSELVVNPDIEFVFNNSFSVAAGYVLNTFDWFDSVYTNQSLSGGQAQFSQQTKSAKYETKAAIVGLTGAQPSSTIHAGIVTAKAVLNSDTSWVTYARGGRVVSNVPSKSGYHARLNSDLSTKLLGKLSLALRYRFQVLVGQVDQHLEYYNRGRVIAGYSVTPNWSVNLENEFTVNEATLAGFHTNYQNEQYLGMTYKF